MSKPTLRAAAPERGRRAERGSHRRPTGSRAGQRRIDSAAPAGLVLALLLAGCSSAAAPQPSAPPATPAPTSAPTLKPTPVPHLLLIAEDEPEAAETLRRLAAERGWEARMVAPDDVLAAANDSQFQIQAVVVYRAPPVGLPQVPTVLVEVEDVAPQATVSTVGVPGARYDQAGFLAGVMVGLATQVEWAGQVTRGADPVSVAYQAGFEQGLKVGCPRCRLVSLGLGEATADEYRARGVDVVFVPPGADAFPIAEALGHAGLWIVWIGPLPEDFPLEALAGRVAYDPQPLIVPALQALLDGSQGQAWPYTIANGGIVLADLNEQALSPGRQRLLLEAYQAVATGELDIGIDPP